MSSTKRRLKIIDFQMRNLSQWVVSNHHDLSHHLEQIKEQVNSLYIKIRLDELKMNNGGKTAEAEESTTFSILMQAINKKPIEKVGKEDIQQYYALLLQELQELDNKISKVSKQAILESPFTNAQFLKNDVNNRQNGNNWLNKNSPK